MQVTSSRVASWIDMEPLASWVCGPVRRTGGRAPREGIERNPSGSTLLALDAGLDLERNFAGNRDWAFHFETAKPECIVCFASVQVKDNRKFLLKRKGARKDLPQRPARAGDDAEKKSGSLAAASGLYRNGNLLGGDPDFANPAKCSPHRKTYRSRDAQLASRSIGLGSAWSCGRRKTREGVARRGRDG